LAFVPFQVHRIHPHFPISFIVCPSSSSPSSDPSFSRSTYATGALPLLTGADPFSSSSLFSGVSNACWEEHDGSSWGLSLDCLVHLYRSGRTKNGIALEAAWSCFPFTCVLNAKISGSTNSKPCLYFTKHQLLCGLLQPQKQQYKQTSF